MEAESHGEPPPAYSELPPVQVNNKQAPQSYNTSYPPQQGYPAQQGYSPQYPPQRQAGDGYNQGYPFTDVRNEESQAQTDINDHCTWSTFTCLCCLLGFICGWAALFKSAEVCQALKKGDRGAARRHSKKAKAYNVAGCVFGFFVTAFLFYFAVTYHG